MGYRSGFIFFETMKYRNEDILKRMNLSSRFYDVSESMVDKLYQSRIEGVNIRPNTFMFDAVENEYWRLIRKIKFKYA